MLYGVETGELDNFRDEMEKILDVSFSAHESEYHGGEYFRLAEMDLNVILQENFMEDDGEVTEAEFPEQELLIYISGDEIRVCEVSDVLRKNNFSLLKSSTY